MRYRLCLLASTWLFLALVSLGISQRSSAVWLIPIDTQITPATAQFVASRIEEANEAVAGGGGPLALVFLLDTPGGRIDAAEDIVNSILQDAQVPTIAVVQNAISAGAIIAMSAEQVAMLPGSSIGAATAINAFTGEDAGEKVNSVWRSQFRAVAEARGRNEDVAVGMVSKNIEVPGLATDEELITLTAAQAVEYDIANLEARSIQDALEQLGYGGVAIERLEPTLAERLAGTLTSPLVAALLLAIGIGGILIELFTPGFGFPGAIGAVALMLFFGATFIAQYASAWGVALLVAGIVLIALEIFVIPGFGVAGVMGLLAIGGAIFVIFESRAPVVLSYTVLFGGALVGLALWLLPNARFANALTLSTRLTNSSDEDILDEDLHEAHAVKSLYDLAGQQGVANSDLRPAGVARFGSRRVDVVTEGDFVSRGTPIEVLRVEGNRVTVRAVEA